MSSVNIQFDSNIAIVDRTKHGADSEPVNKALDSFTSAVTENGGSIETVDYWTETEEDEYLVIGKTNDQAVRNLLEDPVTDAESVTFEWADSGDGTALVVAGGDNRGLMYALFELAERVDANGIDALSQVDDTIETPDNAVRGIDRFIEGPVEDEWLFEDDFWHYYFERLARSRFNRFVLTTGYDTAYLSPPYPFFVEVPEYPDVRVSDEIDITRSEHLAQLRRIGELCHEYGLEFVFATWQQRPWSANPNVEMEPGDQGLLVEGLPEADEEYTDYCVQGLKRLLKACPEIDGVQLRVNFESGVGDRSTAEDFWREIIMGVDEASQDRNGSLDLDIRAKGLTDDMIQWAQETGINVTVPTKYWCESTGLPYHNTQMREEELANLDDMNKNRRYSYSDLLEKPRFYDVMYRLWVTGTNRIFLWGDPDYTRRFSQTTQFGGSKGFEIAAPLSLKGGHHNLQDEKWPLFAAEELRDYEWEDERYWAWYRLFGRHGYSADASSDIWEREFEARFGQAGDAVLDAYRTASKILPLITASHLTRHAALNNWAELDTGGALFAEHNINEIFGEIAYADAEPSDPGLFYQIDEFVDDCLTGTIQEKYSPLQVARWYDYFARETREAVRTAEEKADEVDGEIKSTFLDMRMLADLATYHAEKTRAAIALDYYQKTDESPSLFEAERHMRRAVDAWESLAERGSGSYHDDLVFGMGPFVSDAGNWADRLPELEADLAELEQLCNEEEQHPSEEPHGIVSELECVESVPFENPTLGWELPDSCSSQQDLVVELTAGELNGFEDMTLYYRHTNQTEGAFESVPMQSTDRGFRAVVPEEYLNPRWDLLVYAATADSAGNTIVAPGLYDADSPTPYHVVEVTSDDT